MPDLSDPAAVRERTRDAKRAEQRRHEMIQAVMGLKQGREWVWQILGWCHVFQNPYSVEPLATAFACGEMNIGQRLMADLQAACPELYLQMTNEAAEKQDVLDEVDARADESAGGGLGEPEPGTLADTITDAFAVAGSAVSAD